MNHDVIGQNMDMIGRGGGHGHHGGGHHGHHGHGPRGHGGWAYGAGPWAYGPGWPCDPYDPECPWLVPDVYISGKAGHGGAPRLPPPGYYGPPAPQRRPLGRQLLPPPTGDAVVRLARSVVLAFEQGRSQTLQDVLRRRLLAALSNG